MPHLTTSAAPVTQLHYQDLGEGPPVVLIHGWPLSHRKWESQVNALTAAGFRCVAYDRRGFGESGRPAGGYDYDTFASDLHELLVHLDLKGVTLAGFSMGGGEVARYIGRYGEARIARAILLGAVPPFLLKTADNPRGADKEVFEGMIGAIASDRIGFLDQFYPNFYNADSWAPGAHADLIVPLEISAKHSHEMIGGSRLEVIAGAPHGVAATHAGVLNELMLDFLRG